MLKIYQVTKAKFNNLYLDSPIVSFVKYGTKRLYFNNEIYDVKQNEMIIIPHGVEFHNENIPNQDGLYEAHVLNIESHIINKINQIYNSKPKNNVPMPISNGKSEIKAAFDNVWRNDNDINIPQEIIDLRIEEMLFWLAKNNYFLNPNNINSTRLDVIKIINSDISFDWELENIANKMGFGVSNLRKKLANENTSFQKILKETRMIYALNLILSTNKSITDISFCVGYSSISRFSENFKIRFGISPKALSLHNENIIGENIIMG